MTAQEQQLIEDLIERIRNSPPPVIDREADDLIRRAIGTRPDALYILAQSVLIQDLALKRANAQIDQLRRQSPTGSFLGGGTYQQGYQPSYQQAYQPGYESVPPPPPRSRFSDFLHSAAETAAGVVAGEVAFSALSSLFGHHGGGYGEYGGGSETVVNNYYEGGNERPLDRGLSPDLEDRRFAGVDDNRLAHNEAAVDDDTLSDVASSDDDSSGDDSSGDSSDF